MHITSSGTSIIALGALALIGCNGATHAAPPTKMPESARAVAGPAPSGTVITLGTRGGPFPTTDRAPSSNLLVVNDSLYVIDAGDGVLRRIVESGHDFTTVDKIFLTHLHSDHTGGFATLINAAWEFNREQPIDVYGGGAARLAQGALEYLAPNLEIRWAPGKTTLSQIVRAHDVEPGVVYQDGNVKVIAVENAHFHFREDSPAHGKYRSYAYRFELPNRVVVFTGDTAPSDAVTELAKGADLLVSEVGDPQGIIDVYKQNGVWQKKKPAEQEGLLKHLMQRHMMPEAVGKLAAKAGVKKVVLTHVVPSPNPRESHKRYIDEAKQFYTGPIVVADDLMRF
jgi:ribonuclease BN (tRNA processing enzyme)